MLQKIKNFFSYGFWRKTTNEGEKLPKFYYGLGYRDWCCYKAYWFPIPFNYFIRYWKWINNKWNRFRRRPSWVDKEILKAREKAVMDLSRYNVTLELRLDAERERGDKYFKKYLEKESSDAGM